LEGDTKLFQSRLFNAIGDPLTDRGTVLLINYLKNLGVKKIVEDS